MNPKRTLQTSREALRAARYFYKGKHSSSKRHNAHWHLSNRKGV